MYIGGRNSHFLLQCHDFSCKIVVSAESDKEDILMEFMILAGGLLIVIVAVIVAVVSSVSAAVAADQDVED